MPKPQVCVLLKIGWVIIGSYLLLDLDNIDNSVA